MDAPKPPPPAPVAISDREAGVTLIELLVALALFGLIGLAGLGLLSSVLDVRARTDGRLQRLSDLQRAFQVLADDVMQAEASTLRLDPNGLGFDRKTADQETGSMIRYGVQGGDLVRSIDLAPPQTVLDRANAARWRIHLSTGETTDIWPLENIAAAGPASPRALELVLTLSPAEPGPVGEIRRVVDLAVSP